MGNAGSGYYGGESSISSKLANKWLSVYWKNNSSSTNENIREVAYMLDMGIWNDHYQYEYDFVKYAIGGPTLEMYCKSYKDTHPNKYIECTYTDDIGYRITWNGGTYTHTVSGLVPDEKNGIYIKSSTSKADSMWIASPAAHYLTSNDYASRLMVTSAKGKVTWSENRYNIGFRPIVCLESNVRLEKNESTGNYRIIQ